MNILLTSSGRRTYLVDYFKRALGDGGLVFAANSQMSPALLRADKNVITPLIYDENYIPFLLDFCRKNDIGLLVPLFDIDLPVLAGAKEEFRKIGTFAAVSDAEAIAVCNDKYRMYRFLSSLGVGCPETAVSVAEARQKIREGKMCYPLFIKPRLGMGSIGIDEAQTEEELEVLSWRCERKIVNSYLRYEAAAFSGEEVAIQQKVEGTEFGLDVINDFSGGYVTTIVRKKIAMRAGETDEAVVLGPEDPCYGALVTVGEKLSKGLRHIGNLDVDVLMEEKTLEPYVIDMNARFGGGYPFSHAAGADLPRAYVLWAEGREAGKELFCTKSRVHAYKDMTIKRYD